MKKIMFVLLGVPMMIMSFFSAKEVLPYVQEANLVYNGEVIELSAEVQQNFEAEVKQLIENSLTMPAFGVVLHDEFMEFMKDGIFVKLKFDQVYEVNDLQFDELIFKVEQNNHGFNLVRGMNGIYQGRCIFLDLQDGDMSQLYNFVTMLPQINQPEAQKSI